MISYCLRLAIVAVGHKLRINSRNFLRDETVLHRAVRVFLVTERHRAQLHQSTACVTHVTDVAFEARRRDRDAQSAIGIDQHLRADEDGGSSDSRYKRAGLCALRADADYVRLAHDADI